jgi:hypothetical protein
MAALGKQLEVELRKHFQLRDREPNARNWPKRHFWRRVKEATALTSVTESSATVSIASPELMHKVSGGTIVPKRGGALAIPISPEAYKVDRARLFPRPLTMIVRSGRPPLLVETGLIGKSKSWKLHYVLLKSVTHAADPRALPQQDKLESALLARARVVVDRLLKPRMG